ncbi:MAG: hypothetical protein ACYC6I_06020 [Bacillota bacterium]
MSATAGAVRVVAALAVDGIGQGHGHGVGMSQWGAYERAVKGFPFDLIRKHFYQGITITPMSGQ